MKSTLCLAIACLNGLALADQTPTTVTGTTRAQAQADDSSAPDKPGPWFGRIRAEGIIPLNHSAPFNFQGSSFYGYALHVSQKIAFEGDISYFFNKNFALELSANAPTQQNVSLATVGNLGTIDLVIPMLIAQYHLVTPKSQFSPYVGLGLTWNHIQSQNFSGTGSLTTVTQDTSGFVIQVGLDVPVGHDVYLNLDFRHVQMIPNLKDNSGNILTDVNISPNIFSLGFGYRF